MTKFNLDIPKMGYFLLTRHEKGFVGKQIFNEQVRRGFSEEDAVFTHVETMGGGPYSIRVAPPFTKVINILDTYKGRYVKIVKYKGELFETKRYKVAFWAASHCNLQYDWLGVIKFRLKFLFHRKRKYFCSESCAWALKKEFPEAGPSPWLWMPAHFLGCSFDLVYKGYIS